MLSASPAHTHAETRTLLLPLPLHQPIAIDPGKKQKESSTIGPALCAASLVLAFRPEHRPASNQIPIATTLRPDRSNLLCSAPRKKREGRLRGERIAVSPLTHARTHDAFRRGAVSSSGEGGDGLAAGWERLDLHWVAAAVADRGKSG